MFEKPAIQKFIAQARKLSYRPRQLIIRDSDSAELFLLLEGSVSLIAEHEGGRQAVLAYLYPGDFFGESSLSVGRPQAVITTRARTGATVAVMGAEDFSLLTAEHPELALVLMAQLASRLGRAHRQIADQFFLDVTERLTRTLGELAGYPDAIAGKSGITIRVTDQELALLVGCSREMIARSMTTLENAGHISTEGRNVLVRSSLQQ